MTCRLRSGRGVSMNFRPRLPKARFGRASRRSTRGRAVDPFGSKRSATLTPSAAAMRLSEATLAFDLAQEALRQLGTVGNGLEGRAAKTADGPEPLADVGLCFSGLRVHRR